LPGDNGKQEFPVNNGFLSRNVGAFYLIIEKSSPVMHPIDHISMAGP